MSRIAVLETLYEQYLIDQDSAAFIKNATLRYTVGALERMTMAASRQARRAAVLALGLVADYSSNHPLGRALADSDRGVRMLAENALRAVWVRAGSPSQQLRLEAILRLNTAKKHEESLLLATQLIEEAPWFAEAWNQRAVAYYCLGRYRDSIHDCHESLELNPYHFGAAAGMGQCHLQLGNHSSALECFRRALSLNQDLEGVRANVVYLERALKERS